MQGVLQAGPVADSEGSQNAIVIRRIDYLAGRILLI